MSSTNTYSNQTIPYFYIIRHIESGKLYAGSRWANGCYPDEFMKVNGYTTSAEEINSIIKIEGLHAFEILRIDTYCDNYHVYIYETAFLMCNNCAKSDSWFNKHNNSGMAFGTNNFSETIKRNNVKKYGYEHTFQVPEFREKAKQTKKELYGDENYNNKIKHTQTCLDKYGVEYYTNRKGYIQTCLNQYNVINTFQIPEFIEKAKQTKKELYGDENYTNRCKAKNTNLKKYGYEYPTQSKKVKKLVIETNISKYGVKNHSNYPFMSIIESKKTYPKCSISRFFPEFKQFF